MIFDHDKGAGPEVTTHDEFFALEKAVGDRACASLIVLGRLLNRKYDALSGAERIALCRTLTHLEMSHEGYRPPLTEEGPVQQCKHCGAELQLQACGNLNRERAAARTAVTALAAVSSALCVPTVLSGAADASAVEPLYRCAGARCPGLPWRASDTPHPATCVGEPSVRGGSDALV